MSVLKLNPKMHFLYILQHLELSKDWIECERSFMCIKIYQSRQPAHAKDTDCSKAPGFWNVSQLKNEQGRCCFLRPFRVIYLFLLFYLCCSFSLLFFKTWSVSFEPLVAVLHPFVLPLKQLLTIWHFTHCCLSYN